MIAGGMPEEVYRISLQSAETRNTLGIVTIMAAPSPASSAANHRNRSANASARSS